MRGFDAYTQRQFVTESPNINSLEDHSIWSTIKILPATLPEPSSMDRGPRTGLLEHLPTQIWMSVRGWERILGVGSCAMDLGSGIGGGGRTGWTSNSYERLKKNLSILPNNPFSYWKIYQLIPVRFSVARSMLRECLGPNSEI